MFFDQFIKIGYFNSNHARWQPWRAVYDVHHTDADSATYSMTLQVQAGAFAYNWFNSLKACLLESCCFNGQYIVGSEVFHA